MTNLKSQRYLGGFITAITKCFLFWDNDPKAISIPGLKWVANLADSHHKYYCKLSSKDPPNYPKVPGCPNQWWRYDVHTWPTIDPAWHKVPSGGNKVNKNAGNIGKCRKLVGFKNIFRVLVLFKVNSSAFIRLSKLAFETNKENMYFGRKISVVNAGIYCWKRSLYSGGQDFPQVLGKSWLLKWRASLVFLIPKSRTQSKEWWNDQGFSHFRESCANGSVGFLVKYMETRKNHGG